ncbi:MAG: hypothetical protein WC655_28750 [Candidatus Hydrogenedentales bacterium]|jgi:hypothetical protein
MSTKEKIVLSRQELYLLVWSKPMRMLAPELTLSDVVLARLCRKQEIPLPGRGYWRRIETGKEVMQQRLPDPERKWDSTFWVTRLAPGEEQSETSPPQVPAYELFECDPENRITVTEQLVNPHVLTKHSKGAFRGARTDDKYGWMIPNEKPCLDIQVSQGCLDRALRIMDAIVKALIARGINVEISEEPYRISSTVAIVQGEKVYFRVFESPMKGLRKERWSGKMKEGMVPSGRLVLEVNHNRRGMARQLRDKTKKLVEERLNEFVVEVYREADRLKAWREAEERRLVEAEKERLRQAQIRREQEALAVKVRELDSYIANWRKAKEIREFLDAVNEANVAYGGFEEGSKHGEWLAWAISYADSIDPLVPKVEVEGQ